MERSGKPLSGWTKCGQEGLGALVPGVQNPRLASGQTLAFLLLWPATILLFPSLGKLAFVGDENINMLGLEAWSVSISNEPTTVPPRWLPSLGHGTSQSAVLKTHLASKLWRGWAGCVCVWGRGLVKNKIEKHPRASDLMGLSLKLK